MFTPENVPNLLKQIDEIKSMLAKENSGFWQHLDACQKEVQEVHDSLDHPKQKQVLAKLMADMVEARKDVEAVGPEILAEIKKQEQSLDRIKDYAAQIEQAEKNFEAQLQADADLASFQAPPLEAPVPVDPKLGAGLEKELLQALGLLESLTRAKDVFSDAGSIAKHWDESEDAHEPRITPPSPPVSPPPVTPAPATPGSGVFRTVRKKSIPPKSAPPKSGDAWEGLSQAGE